jgi:twitching motility two-component system response regulator PilG
MRRKKGWYACHGDLTNDEPYERTEKLTPLILIIDDSPTIRAVLTMIAQGEGYPTCSFADDYAALRWLISPEGCIPALIFLDLTMPRMDGLTTLRHLRSKTALAAVPVIVLTCCEGTTDRLKARLAGASEYLTKPFTQEQIVALLTRYLDTPANVA